MRRKIRRLTGCCVAGGLVVGAAGVVAGAPTAARVERAAARPSYALYKVTVGITGRATQDGSWPCHGSSPCNWGLGGLAKQSYQAVFHIDETIKGVILTSGRFSLPETGGSVLSHVVNGSYHESGQYDENGDGHLVSFSCGGRLGDLDPEAGYNFTGRPHGGSWVFTAELLQHGLKGTTTQGGPSGSPCDNQASFVDGTSSSFGLPTWTAKVTVAKGQIGQRTITKFVTGPPSRYRPPSDCKDEGGGGGSCTFSLSWHGSIKFKRTH